MNLVAPFETPTQAVCPPGQPWQWLGYEADAHEHWLGVEQAQPLCAQCWQASQCPRQFAYPASAHETLLGLIPMNTRASQRRLQQARPWIEPAQSYEKNQLGLSRFFLNSLRLTWMMCLRADAAVLLRALALLRRPACPLPLGELTPSQGSFDLED